MPFFTVRIRKPLGIFHKDQREPIRNPFEIIDPFSAALRTRYEERVWERMEARDEKAIRAFYKKAQKNGLSAVAGFELVSIEPATQPNLPTT